MTPTAIAFGNTSVEPRFNVPGVFTLSRDCYRGPSSGNAPVEHFLGVENVVVGQRKTDIMNIALNGNCANQRVANHSEAAELGEDGHPSAFSLRSSCQYEMHPCVRPTR
jgi:hypothetical protein